MSQKFSKKFRQMCLRFIIYCTHKGFYNRTVFYNIQAFHAVYRIDLSKLTLLTLFDDFVNLA